MSITTERPTGTPSDAVDVATDRWVAGTEYGLVVHDLYKDIHKAIRSELFAVVGDAGRLDPDDRQGRAALADQVRDVVAMLASHAEHEDGAIQPVLSEHLPVLAEMIEADHVSLDARTEHLVSMASAAVDAPASARRARLHHLYLELGSFTSAYLEHQDVEERVVMPALESAVGVDAVVALHEAILGTIPPEEMSRTLALMLPAMNLDDRVEMLGGMQANAPAEVFEGVWNLAGSVLAVPDRVALGRRLGLS
jgi:hypothetical protein